MHYLTTNSGNFLQVQYGFYRFAVQIHYGLKSIYYKLKKVKACNVTVPSNMMKCH